MEPTEPENNTKRYAKPMNELIPIVEGALFAANGPLSAQDVAKLFDEEEKPALAEIRKAMELLQKGYEKRGIRLVEVASGFRFQVADHVAPYIARSVEERPARYSRALLETLALIAYRQPITRGEIEDIRGVVVSTNIIKTLDEQEWIRIVGYKDVPGKPALYATTKTFLDHFGLKSLDELPPLSELKPMETIDLADEASKDEPIVEVEASTDEAEALTESDAQAQAAAIANAAIEAAMNAVAAEKLEDAADEDFNDDDIDVDEIDEEDVNEDDIDEDDIDEDDEDDEEDEDDEDDEDEFLGTEDDFDFGTEELDDVEDKSTLEENASLEEDEDEEEAESLSSILDELENSDFDNE